MGSADDPSDRSAGGIARPLAAAAFTAAGPLAMAAAGFDVPLILVGVASIGGAWLPRRAPGPSWRTAAAIAAAAALALALTGASFAGLWCGLGLLVGRWVALDAPPHPALPPAPGGSGVVMATIWGLAMVRAWNPTYRYDPAAIAVTQAVFLAAIAALPWPIARRRWAALCTATTFAVVAIGTTSINVTRSSGAIVLGGCALLAVASVASPVEGRWTLARLGPLAWCVPAMVWVSANVAVWSSGIRIGSIWAYDAWRQATSDLPAAHTDLIAATAGPFAVLALVAIGAHLAMTGRVGARRVAEGAVLTIVSGAAVGASLE
jgi:hypothetical protein